MLDSVDSEFSGFDDGYFDRVANEYVDSKRPMIEQRYGDNTRRSTFDLARRGNYESSASARVFSRLAQQKASEEAAAAQEGMTRANTLRSQVEDQRSRARQSAYDAIDAAPDDILDEGMEGVDPRFAVRSQQDADGGMVDRGVGYPKFGAIAGGGPERGERSAVMPVGRERGIPAYTGDADQGDRSTVMPGPPRLGGTSGNRMTGERGGVSRGGVGDADQGDRSTVMPSFRMGQPGGGFEQRPGRASVGRTGGSTPAKSVQAPSFSPISTKGGDEDQFASMRQRAVAAPMLRVM
jgi:hypothetical protein